MKKEQHEAIVKGLLIQEQERFDKMVEKFKEELEAEKAKRDPIRVSFDWKASKFFWKSVIVLTILVGSLVGNGWQFFDRREQKRTLQQFEHYSIIVRLGNALGRINANDTYRILRDLRESSDTTDLLYVVHRTIREYESGEATIQRVQTQNRTP